MISESPPHPFLARTLFGGGLFLLICAGLIYATINEEALKSAWPAFVFGSALIFFGVMQVQKKPWAIKMSIYTLLLAMFAFFIRGFTNLLQVTQGSPDKLPLSLWGWFSCAGMILTLFILFRQLKVKAPPSKR